LVGVSGATRRSAQPEAQYCSNPDWSCRLTNSIRGPFGLR
jgi:hypothetical protein